MATYCNDCKIGGRDDKTIDPAAFVAEAERITNARDADAASAVYTDDAVVELITDGVHERYVGLPHITEGWRAMKTGAHSRTDSTVTPGPR